LESDVTHVHRRSPRTSQSIPLKVAFRQRGEDKVSVVNTVNFSRTGLRVQSKLTLEPGQALMALPGKDRIPSGYCRVVWVSGNEAGLEFIH